MSPQREDSSGGESTGSSIPFEYDKKTQQSGDEDSESEEDEDVYVVEKIVGHEFKKNGNLLLNVKWKGYDAPEDQTLEPVEGLLEGATEVVEEYFASIGGRPRPPGKQAPGRKRKSMNEAKSTPGPKKTKKPRGRTNGTETSLKKAARDSPGDDERDISPDDWEEKDVDKVETIVPDQKGNLYAYAQFKNGKSVKIAIEQCYEKMPMKMLKFYEAHLYVSPTYQNKETS
ncbi:hypothetical protein PISL3812_01374 [Talaromyces islandicus]|uniref:Chromo domain-containing protein n=1 Tax=Talaromyces islandicus TaxID=28573 RepID=A0A0U1LLZ1_TALIS|nr:hypothetical protein PISL3812_01374 [Talaromyces islandicus]